MRKKGAIITIIFSFISIFILSGILLLSIINKNNFNNIFSFNTAEFKSNFSSNKETKEYSHTLQNIDTINIDLDVGDITIKNSESDKIKIIENTSYKSNHKRELKISTNGTTLEINREKTTFLDNIGINNYRYLEIYIPKNYDKDLLVNSAVGDINIDGKFDLNKLDINLSVGDIEFSKDVKANDLNVLSSVGDIEMQNIEAKNYKIECSIGDKEIKNISKN